MPVDFEHELSNGWGKWQNLVLSALKELKDDGKATHDQVTTLATEFALLKQRFEDQADNTDRIEELEKTSSSYVTKEGLKKDRRWLVTIALTILGSIAIPCIAIVVASTGVFG